MQTPEDAPAEPLAPDPEMGRRLKRGAKIAAIVLLCAFVAVRAVRFVEERRLEQAAAGAAGTPTVDVVTTTGGSDADELVLPGQTAAWYESTIYARVNGYVARWLVDIGDHVRKNQVLATLDTPELDAELAAARAELGVAEAQLKARDAEVELSRTTNERWRTAPKGVVAEQERDEKRADYESAVARRGAAAAQVELDRARVTQFAALTAFKQVVAPFDGTITERRIDIGNLVTAGSTAATTPLYRIAQSDPLRVYVDLPQNASLELMRAGTPAQVRSSGLPGRSIDGKVARSAQALNARARTMRVEVDVPNPDLALVPGMYVTVALHLPQRGLVAVPAAALVFRTGRPQVARVDAHGRVEFADVAIARDDGTRVELSSGVAAGDRLILNVSSQIENGQAVTMNSAATAERPR